jgi:hypothetical protein
MAIPAQASTDAACSFDGTATTTPPVKLQGGSGNYTFSSSGTTTPIRFRCVGHNSAHQVDVETFDVSSAGSYVNNVCGTGSATSTAGTKGGTISNLASVGGNANLTSTWYHQQPIQDLAHQLDLSYTIAFTGGQGTLTFVAPAEISGGGAVSISAEGDANQAGGECTTHFSVHGALDGTAPSTP